MHDFELVCGRHYLQAWIISLVYLSNILSGTVFPFLSNWKGRRFTILLSGFLASGSILIAGFVSTFYVWMFLVFIAGMAFGGLEITGKVYLSEISGKNFRFNSNALLNIFWAGSQTVFGVLVWINDYWRNMFVYGIGICFMTGLVLGVIVIDESPRYLISKQRIEETKQLLQKMTFIN